MKNLKKTVVLLVVLCMAVSLLVGCQSTEIRQPTETSSEPERSGSTQQTTTEEETQEIVPVKIFANWPPEMSAADKAWVEAVEKGTHTKLSFEIPPSANYNERLSIMLAGGEYADAILFGDPTAKVFVSSVENGIVIPITEHVENSPNLKAYSYDVSWMALKVKGDNEIYGIPRTTIQRADGFIVREDWLDAIGFKVPEDNLLTLDQFTEILTKFTRNDPDNNGRDDTYGMSANSITPLVGYAFGLKGWQKTNGGDYEYMDPQFSKTDDSYKKALEYTAYLFKEGLIDPNFATINVEAAKARMKQGVTGVREEFAGWIVEYQTDAEKINPEARFTYINGVKDAGGKFERPAYGTGIFGCWGITNNSKYPERVVSVFDYLLSDEGWAITKYGVEGVTYETEGGKKIALDEFNNFRWSGASVRRNNDPEFFVKINMQEKYKEPVKKWLAVAIDGVISSLDYGYRPAAADKPELIDYGKRLEEVIAKIILGESPSSEWDKVLDGWYKAGGEEYVQQMNAHIKSMVNR